MIQVVTGQEAAWAVAGTIATAFANLPAAQYLVPGDPADRTEWLNVAQPYFAILVSHATKYGTVYATADLAAVAVWFDGTIDAPPPDDYEGRRLAAVGDQFVERFAKLDDALEAAHPQDPAHHHLAFLAVLPEWQGQGLGDELMQHHHRTLDHFGIHGYLEAANLRLIDVYRARGYTPTGHITVDGQDLFTQMLRRPPVA